MKISNLLKPKTIKVRFLKLGITPFGYAYSPGSEAEIPLNSNAVRMLALEIIEALEPIDAKLQQDIDHDKAELEKERGVK